MIALRVRSFLDQHQVKYVTIQHSQAFTAQEVAASAHIPGKEIAKTVIVKVGNRMAMAVLPASRRLSVEAVKAAVGTEDVRVAKEHEFQALFPGCELGAMPPFGNLYGLDVYVHPELAEDEAIAFNAGSHTELIRMTYADFDKLVQPKVLVAR
jgi:Ala-tRNA(Pro) deacylase